MAWVPGPSATAGNVAISFRRRPTAARTAFARHRQSRRRRRRWARGALLEGATSAVNVTVWPAVAGLGLAESVVVVAIPVTIRLRSAELGSEVGVAEIRGVNRVGGVSERQAELRFRQSPRRLRQRHDYGVGDGLSDAAKLHASGGNIAPCAGVTTARNDTGWSGARIPPRS